MQPLSEMIRQHLPPTFWRWLKDILSLLPPQVQAYIFNRQRLTITAIGNELWFLPADKDAHLRSKTVWDDERQDWVGADRVGHLHRLARDHFIDLNLPEGCILQQTVTLPRLAGENLQGSVAFGLPTWTPFSLDEIYFAAQVVSFGAQQIVISIKYTMRSHAQPLIDRASQTGLRPDRLAFDADGRWVALLNPQKRQRILAQKRLDAALAISVVILLIGAIAAASWRQSNHVAAYQSLLREELALFRKEEAERQNMENAAIRQTIVARRRSVSRTVTEVLVAIGSYLPQGVNLNNLELEEGRGRLEVEGTDGQNLRETLKKTGLITDIAVSSSDTRRSATVTFLIPEIAP